MTFVYLLDVDAYIALEHVVAVTSDEGRACIQMTDGSYIELDMSVKDVVAMLEEAYELAD